LSKTEPRFLIIETSGRIGQVALGQGTSIRAVRRLDEARKHARDLVPQVAELFSERGRGPKDIRAVIVSRGPGSYTGLRVGIMSAKTFAFATGCKLLGIETFAAIARQAPANVAAVDVIGDAQQDKIYLQSFMQSDVAVAPLESSPSASGAASFSPPSVGRPRLVASAPLSIVALADWLEKTGKHAWVTGPGLRLHQRLIADSRPCLPPELWDPQPATLLELAYERYQAGESDDLWRMEPIYLRPSSAEEKWRDK
jgi:tRNA threonylcarbamoyladenosine biosynthesis protein TsaB